MLLAQTASVGRPDNQKIVTPSEKQVPNDDLGNIRYIKALDNWKQSGFSTVSCSPTCTVTLPAGLRGIDESNRSMYYVRIVQGSTSEIQMVIGGNYNAAL